MSRVGSNPVPIPSGTTVAVEGRSLKVKGKLGEKVIQLVREVNAEVADGQVMIRPINQSKRARSMWGTFRSLTQGAVQGVSEGFTRNLEINGVGYRAAVEGSNLKLQLGYSHDVLFPIPKDIQIKCERPTAIAVSGSDKQRVGQVAAEIRSFRSPEPYKGKGIKYDNEYIFRKEGKKK